MLYQLSYPAFARTGFEPVTHVVLRAFVPKRSGLADKGWRDVRDLNPLVTSVVTLAFGKRRERRGATRV